MSILLSVILPVFLVLAFGYVMRWRGLISDDHVDALMTFAQGFAIPCLLFRAIATLDLGENFDPALLGSFYAGALTGFAAGLLGARYLFARTWEESVAVGFCGLFSNSLLLGLPITERAYGHEALTANFAIIALHAPFCYAVGITAMEIARARGAGLAAIPAKVLKAMFSNALIIGISLGLAVNLTGLPLPRALADALDLMASAGLPVALFGLGGVLFRYRPGGDLRIILFIVSVSLVLHPALVWLFGSLAGLTTAQFRSAVITAATAPGVNAYLFANMYDRAKPVAASAVLIGTIACMFTAAFWLTVLP
jgi:malonate transporter and related proteins